MGLTKMKMKGVSQVFVMAMFAMFGLAVTIVIFFLYFGHIFIIIPILKENEVERHSIILANLFLSSDKLTYFDGFRSYRGVFDKSKLDNEMINQENALSFLKIFQQKAVSFQIKHFQFRFVTLTMTFI